METTSEGQMKETNFGPKARRQMCLKRGSSLSGLRCESHHSSETLIRASSVRGLQKETKEKPMKAHPTTIGSARHAGARQSRDTPKRQPPKNNTNCSTISRNENKGKATPTMPSTISLVQHELSPEQPVVDRRGSLIDGVWTPSFDQPDFSNDGQDLNGNQNRTGREEEEESWLVDSSLAESSLTSHTSSVTQGQSSNHSSVTPRGPSKKMGAFVSAKDVSSRRKKLIGDKSKELICKFLSSRELGNTFEPPKSPVKGNSTDILVLPLESPVSLPEGDGEVVKLYNRRTKTHLQRSLSGTCLDPPARSDLTSYKTPTRIRRRGFKTKSSKDSEAPSRMVPSTSHHTHNIRGELRRSSSVPMLVNGKVDLNASHTSLRIADLVDLPVVPVGSTEEPRHNPDHFIRGLESSRTTKLQRGKSFKIPASLRDSPRKQRQAKVSLGSANLGASFPELEYWHNACAPSTNKLPRSSSARDLYQSPVMLSRQFVVALPEEWKRRSTARSDSASKLKRKSNKPKARKTSSSQGFTGNISETSLCPLPLPIESKHNKRSSASFGQVGVSRKASDHCFQWNEESLNLSTEWQSFAGTSHIPVTEYIATMLN
eukprot:scaffold4223_cov189-Amphora_coffeaeformis.AAC.48